MKKLDPGGSQEGGEPTTLLAIARRPRGGDPERALPGPQLPAGGGGATTEQRAEGGDRETLTPGPASRLGLPFCPPRPGPSAGLAAFEVPIQSGATSIYTTGQKSL